MEFDFKALKADLKWAEDNLDQIRSSVDLLEKGGKRFEPQLDNIQTSTKYLVRMMASIRKRVGLPSLSGMNLGATTVSAAKDTGDAKGDKSRKASLADLVAKAAEMQEAVDLGSFPEVKEAVDAVKALQELSLKIDEVSARLKAAPNGTTEAAEAQATLDRSRKNIDVLVAPTMATLVTLETLLLAAAEMEQSFADAKKQLEVMGEDLKSERARLASAAAAVKSSTKLG